MLVSISKSCAGAWQLKFAGVREVAYPFDWMEAISIQGKTNFFEKRVGEYSNAANPNNTENKKVFNTDEEF